MNLILATRFLMGWFDPLDKRLAYMEALDAAINSERSTVRVRTITKRSWGQYGI